MKFKPFKYIALLLIGLLCLGLATIPLTVSYQQRQILMSSYNKTEPDNIFDDEEETSPQDDEKNENVEQKTTVPTFNNAKDTFVYAVDKVENGKGTHIVSTVVCNAVVFGVSGVQNISVNRKTSGGIFYEETVATCDVKAIGENYFGYLYADVNKNTAEARKTSNFSGSKGNFSSSDQKTNTTWTNYVATESPMGLKLFPIQNVDMCEFSYFKKISGNYQFNMNVPVSAIMREYTALLQQNADASKFQITSYNISFKVNIKTAKIVSYSATIKYTMTARGISNLQVTHNTNAFFKKVDTAFDITNPYANA